MLHYPTFPDFKDLNVFALISVPLYIYSPMITISMIIMPSGYLLTVAGSVQHLSLHVVIIICFIKVDFTFEHPD